VNYRACPQKAAWCDDQADKELHIKHTTVVCVSMAAAGVTAQHDSRGGPGGCSPADKPEGLTAHRDTLCTMCLHTPCTPASASG
jgi:hypothetical protein